MEEQTVECVPNFSEGRDKRKIRQIADSISGVSGIRLLDISSGEAANRTVVTFSGTPEAVAEAAFAGVKKAAEVIDMRVQKGTHPRIGATDVLPFVPVSGISLEECAEMARGMAWEIYDRLGIPCYCYEAAALRPERKRLEVCRQGEYEALAAKMADPSLRPDFSPGTFTQTAAKAGATVVGARNFLIAVNFNLDSTSADIASEIAKDVRESGRTVTLQDGTRVRKAGTLPGCKAIGWYIDEYGIAQVSMNITDTGKVPLHKAFTEVCRAAAARGVKVTGTEIIGLVPRKCLTDAGRYFLDEGIPLRDKDEVTENGLMEAAVRAMRLDELGPFDLSRRLI